MYNYTVYLIPLFVIMGFANTALSGQTNWYVSQQSGSDNHNGMSASTPFQDVDAAISQLQPGDTLFFMGSFTNPSYDPSYSFSGNINDPHIWTQENTIRINNLHGQAGAYITLKAYDENTVIKGDGANIWRMINCSYLRVEGFEIEGEVEQIPLETALALQFLYRENGSDISLYRVPPGSTPEDVEQMTLPVLNNIKRPSYTDTRGLYLTNVHHIDLLHLNVHHTPGNGLRVAECDYINIIGNEVHNCSRKSYSGTHGLVVTKATSIDSEEGHKIRILQNKVHHNYNEIYSWAPSKTFITPRIDEGKGISLQRNTVENGWTHGRFLVANNLAYWNGYSGVHSNAGTRMDFVNNTCYMNSYTSTVTYAEGEQAGNNIGISTSEGDDFRIVNNLIVIDTEWGGFPISSRNTSNLEVADNLVYGLNGTPNLDADLEGIATNTLMSAPLLEHPENNDFRLKNNSPAIGLANAALAPDIDFFGNARDNMPDLGAIEYSTPVNIHEPVEGQQSLWVYPNPFDEHIWIEQQDRSVGIVQLFGANGQLMKQEIHWGKKAKIHSSDLPPGIYFLKIDHQPAVRVLKR